MRLFIFSALLIFGTSRAFAFIQGATLQGATIYQSIAANTGVNSFLLLETGDKLLLESGDKIILEP